MPRVLCLILFSFFLSSQAFSSSHIKIFLIGDRVVGKTSFMDALNEREFSLEIPAAMGVSHAFFDRFHFFECSLGFSCEADVIVLCYDLNDEDYTFSRGLEKLKEYKRMFEIEDKIIPIVYLGFKSDLISEEEKEKFKGLRDSFIFSNKNRRGLPSLKKKIVKSFLRQIKEIKEHEKNSD